jgi:hypothetical protein
MHCVCERVTQYDDGAADDTSRDDFACLRDKLDLLVSALHIPFRAIILINKTAHISTGAYLVISKPT